MLAAIGRLKYPIIMPPAPTVLLLCPQFRHPFKAVTPAVLSLCAAVMHRPRLRVRPLLRHDLDGDQPPRPGAGAPSPISPPGAPPHQNNAGTATRQTCSALGANLTPEVSASESEGVKGRSLHRFSASPLPPWPTQLNTQSSHATQCTPAGMRLHCGAPAAPYVSGAAVEKRHE